VPSLAISMMFATMLSLSLRFCLWVAIFVHFGLSLIVGFSF
jgi:hypothetical protein